MRFDGILEFVSADNSRHLNKARFKVTDVALGQVVILVGKGDEITPEFFPGQVVADSIQNYLGFTDVGDFLA